MINNNQTIVNAQKLAKYQDVKRQTNKLLSEISSTDVIQNIKYTDVNVLTNLYFNAFNEVKKLTAKVDKNGNAITYQDLKDELRAKKKNTSFFAWLLAGFIPGLVIFSILWGIRKSRYNNLKKKMDAMTKEAIQSLLLAQPQLIEELKDKVEKLPGGKNKEIIKQAIDEIQKKLQQGKSEKEINNLRITLTQGIASKISKKLEDEILEDIVHGTYDKEKLAKLANSNVVDIFDKEGQGNVLDTIKKIHEGLTMTEKTEKQQMMLSNIKTTNPGGIKKTDVPTDKKKEAGLGKHN